MAYARLLPKSMKAHYMSYFTATFLLIFLGIAQFTQLGCDRAEQNNEDASSLATSNKKHGGSESAWQQAVSQDTITGYRDFLTNNVESNYVQAAMTRLYDLAAETAWNWHRNRSSPSPNEAAAMVLAENIRSDSESLNRDSMAPQYRMHFDRMVDLYLDKTNEPSPLSPELIANVLANRLMPSDLPPSQQSDILEMLVVALRAIGREYCVNIRCDSQGDLGIWDAIKVPTNNVFSGVTPQLPDRIQGCLFLGLDSNAAYIATELPHESLTLIRQSDGLLSSRAPTAYPTIYRFVGVVYDDGLGLHIDADETNPLCLAALWQDSTLTYICGKGQVTTADGTVFEFPSK